MAKLFNNFIHDGVNYENCDVMNIVRINCKELFINGKLDIDLDTSQKKALESITSAIEKKSCNTFITVLNTYTDEIKINLKGGTSSRTANEYIISKQLWMRIIKNGFKKMYKVNKSNLLEFFEATINGDILQVEVIKKS